MGAVHINVTCLTIVGKPYAEIGKFANSKQKSKKGDKNSFGLQEPLSRGYQTNVL